MENRIEIIRKNEYQTSNWSGGTTTQLLIYPRDSKYSDRNFKWRISSARVEAEESVFTHLPGISRIIMVIDGEMTLEHDGRYKVMLSPFEQDSFMGDWTTRSVGKVRDFNLMMAEGCTGRVEVLPIKDGDMVNILLNERNERSKKITEAFYFAAGGAELIIQNEKFDINEGDLLSITPSIAGGEYKINICNKGNREIKIIRAIIYY